MRRFTLILLAAICCTTLFAQDRTYQGKVIDAVYGTPVAYAAVYIHSTPYGEVADNVGEFSFVAPDSLQRVQLVIARENYVIKHLAVDPLNSVNLLIGIRQDNFEASTKALSDSLEGVNEKKGGVIAKATQFVMNDWIALGNPNTNKFDFGRIQTIPTFNPIEGIRLRAGIASTSRLSPHLFLKGYVAYGFGDQRFKYRGEVVYAFKSKVYHDEEFPKNNLNFIYENDLYSPGEMHPRSLNNLLLITYRRSADQATYRNFGEINYEREHKNGFAQTVSLRRSRMIPQGELSFQHHRGSFLFDDSALFTTEVGFQLRYAVREAYQQQKRKRKSIEMTSPVFFFSHTIGYTEALSTERVYQRSEFSAQKRFLLGSVGRLDVVGEAMKIWDPVPFPLLVYPNQRYRHLIENNAFFLNRAMEFMADEQVTLRATMVADDFLLAKVPLLKRMQVKELISLRAAYGRLSEKNDPTLTNNLYDFPINTYKYGTQPYVEGTVGITNILGLLRVEYVHRFTYRDHPDALLGKIRVDVTL